MSCHSTPRLVDNRSYPGNLIRWSYGPVDIITDMESSDLSPRAHAFVQDKFFALSIDSRCRVSQPVTVDFSFRTVIFVCSKNIVDTGF